MTMLHEVLVHYEREEHFPTVAHRNEEVEKKNQLGGGEEGTNICVPSFSERLSIASSPRSSPSSSSSRDDEKEDSMVLVTDYLQIYVFRGQDLDRPLVTLRASGDGEKSINKNNNNNINKRREDLFVAFAKWSFFNNGQFFTSQVGKGQMFVHTRVGRRVICVGGREDMKSDERFVGGFVLPTTTEEEGKKSFTLCAIVERSFYYSSGWVNALSFGNSTKKKKGKRKQCQLELRSIEFNDDEDVVVRNVHQMKKTTLKNVEGMVSVKGFEVDEKTGTVTVVGIASEDDEGRETTTGVTMYSFRCTSENNGELPVVASGKASSSSVEKSNRRAASSSCCEVSVDSDASTATTRIGVCDGNTKSASVWETDLTGEDEFIG